MTKNARSALFALLLLEGDEENSLVIWSLEILKY